MKPRFMTKCAISGAIGAAAMLLAGAAQAALEDRDLDGNGVTDAFYDTDLDITWLRDANVNGVMSWANAVSWAGNFSFGGHTDWRLPSALNSDGSGPCGGFSCTTSEMGHLWYVELGNSAGGPMTNTGHFLNLQSYYWSGTEDATNVSYAWGFYTGSGFQRTYPKTTGTHAMAVANGDVGMVPEPGTYTLMLAGLAGLALARRQRRR